MAVRAEAAGLLGSLHLVSPKFLEQTLDKKLMSGLRVSVENVFIDLAEILLSSGSIVYKKIYMIY